MRVGCYEILVLNDMEVPFKEDIVGDRVYVNAMPGQAYHVQINVYRNSLTGKFPAKYLRFGLYVDGLDVNYWKRLDLSNDDILPYDFKTPVSSNFWGFKKNTTDLVSFVFARTLDHAAQYPANTNTSSNSSSSTASKHSKVNAKNDELGSFRLIIHEAKVTTGVFNNQTGIHDVPKQPIVHGENNEKEIKFWQQASVSTLGGQVISSEKEKFIPLAKWENISSIPLETLVLYYHSVDMIKFLKNPSLNLLVEEKRKRVSNNFESDTTLSNLSGTKRLISSMDGYSERNDRNTQIQGTRPGEDGYESDDTAELVVLPAVKEVPILDLTGDDDDDDNVEEDGEGGNSTSFKWKTITINKT